MPVPLRDTAAPHQKPTLPRGRIRVRISDAYGRSTPCGPETVLKVGRVGPRNKRQFERSHYDPHGATIYILARSLLSLSDLVAVA